MRATISGQEHNGLQDRTLEGCPFREEMDVRSREVSSTHAWSGSRWRRSEIYTRAEVEVWVGTTRSCVVGLEAAILTLPAAFFFEFTAAGLLVTVDLSSGYLDLAVFLLAVTLGCSGDSVPADEMDLDLGVEWYWPCGYVHLGRRILPLAQVNLLGRVPGPLSFGAGMACGGALFGTIERFLSKGRVRLFPLNTALVVGRLFPPQPLHCGYHCGVEHPRRSGSPHMRRTGSCIRSFATCV